MRHRLSQIRIPPAGWIGFPLAAALMVIGAKAWMIGRYASPTPFWDQWDAEGAILYPKYFGGTLRLGDLIAAHNEHRILVTRLWSLLLLDLAGYWDPILQMLANTLLLGGFVFVFVAAFRPILDGAVWFAFALLAAVIFALPFGWENTLAGFQSAWYFVLLFGIAGLIAVMPAAAFSPRWWLAIVTMVIGFFCLASGAFTVAAAFAAGLVQFAVGRRTGRRELLALAVLAGVAVAMALSTPVIPGHAVLKAHSIGQFLRALIEIASWPVPASDALAIPAALAVQAPALLTTAYVIWLRPPLGDRRWLLVALTGWAVLQAVAVAYGRAAEPTSSRYLDVFAIGLALNGACLFYLLRQPPAWWRGRIALAALALWLVLILASLDIYVVKQSMPAMAARGAAGEIQTENLRAYLKSGDIAVLENKPLLQIPYPDPQRLAQIASQPVIRALLPPALVGEPARNSVAFRSLPAAQFRR